MEYTKQQLALIEEHREHCTDWRWWLDTYNDFTEVAKAFGIRTEPDKIHFSGFWSQGDGASFETGPFALIDILEAGQKTLEAKSYGDDPDKFEGYVKEFYLLYRLVFDKIGHHAMLHPEGKQVAESYGRRIWSNSPYCHSFTMCIDESEFSAWTVLDDEALEKCVGLDLEGFEMELLKQLRDCADELYKVLEEEYDSLTDNDNVWEMIVANGWGKEEEDEQTKAA